MIHVLNRQAGRLLRLADGTRDIEQIIQQFADESAIELSRAREDVVGIMAEFLRLGLIRTADDHSK